MELTMGDMFRREMFRHFNAPSLFVDGHQAFRQRVDALFQSRVGIAIAHDTEEALAASLVGRSYDEVDYLNTVLSDCVNEEHLKEMKAVQAIYSL